MVSHFTLPSSWNSNHTARAATCTPRRIALPTLNVVAATRARIQVRGFFDPWDEEEKPSRRPMVTSNSPPPVPQAHLLHVSPASPATQHLSAAELARRASAPGRRVHTETRVMPYSAAAMFAVISNVDEYHAFVPWCSESRVVRRAPDGCSMDAELVIGALGFRERYTSKILLVPNRAVLVDASDSPLFHHLSNEWRLEPHPSGAHACTLHFAVDFAFRSHAHASLVNMFFATVAQRLVGAFEQRAALVASRQLS